ncbi:hypothetical protein OH77DRAFT_1136712 [Trametes cingulata]|nr:hypothetical protein OH77DRAFT_1136712 [Trametes cingulata]
MGPAKTSKSRSSVSKDVHIRYGRLPGRRAQQKVKTVQQGAAEHQSAWRKFRERVAGLSYEDREDYATYDPAFDFDSIDTPFYPVPPGEEGALASHAGGEDELCRELFAEKTPKHDARSRKDRTQNRCAEWASQLPALTDAYLSWQASPSPPEPSSAPRERVPDDVEMSGSKEGPSGDGQDEDMGETAGGEWAVSVMNLFGTFSLTWLGNSLMLL